MKFNSDGKYNSPLLTYFYHTTRKKLSISMTSHLNKPINSLLSLDVSRTTIKFMYKITYRYTLVTEKLHYQNLINLPGGVIELWLPFHGTQDGRSIIWRPCDLSWHLCCC